MTETATGLRELVRDVVSKTEAAGQGDVGDPGQLWRTIVDLGLAGIGLDEDSGGSGGTLRDLAAVAGELAACGVTLPLIEVAAAARCLGSPALDGYAPVTIWPQPKADAQALPGPVTMPGVAFGRQAAAVVLLAADGACYRVPLAGATVTWSDALDGTPLDTVELVVADRDRVTAALDHGTVRGVLSLLAAAGLVGAARAALEATLDHVRARVQFGKPLVRQPSVGIRLAEMRSALLLAEAALDRALGDDGPRPDRVAVARVMAGAAATGIAAMSHQLHGAIGVTAEHRLHRLTTRLWDLRDRYDGETRSRLSLADPALRGGEVVMWDELTCR